MSAFDLRVLPKTLVYPATEPVTLSQLRDHVRVDDNVDDAMLLGYLIAAREAAETSLGRPIVPRSVVVTFEAWPDYVGWSWRSPAVDNAAIEILLPVTSVDSITYLSNGVAAQPWSGFVARTSQGGVTRVRPAAGQSWPQLGDDPLITLTATSGYTSVPETIVQAVLMLAAHFYLNREEVLTGSRIVAIQVPRGFASLLAPHRWQWAG